MKIRLWVALLAALLLAGTARAFEEDEWEDEEDAWEYLSDEQADAWAALEDADEANQLSDHDESPLQNLWDSINGDDEWLDEYDDNWDTPAAPADKCKDSTKEPHPAKSLVANPGFGSGVPKGWECMGGCKLSVKGGEYVVAGGRGKNWEGPTWKLNEKITKGTTYKIMAWVKLSKGSSRVTLKWKVPGAQAAYKCAGARMVSDKCWTQVVGSYWARADSASGRVTIEDAPGGTDLLVKSMTVTPISREEWRKETDARIDKLRKRKITVKLPGGESGGIKVNMVKHGFPFGIAVSNQITTNKEYQNYVKKRFNWAVHENEGKWNWMESQAENSHNFKDFDNMANWMRQNGLQMRGHCVFWEDSKMQNQWLPKITDKNQLKAKMQKRLKDLLTRKPGQFKHWDVDNELLHHSFFTGKLGEQIQAWAHKEVKKLDPTAEQFINEFNVLEECEAKVCAGSMVAKADFLEKNGAPKISFGLQGHFANGAQAYKIRADLDRMFSSGRKSWITELDVTEKDDKVKAQELETVIREAFAHPGVDGIMLWLVWRPQGVDCVECIVNPDFSNKDSGKMVDDLLLKKFRTSANGQVQDGSYTFKGFYGNYEAEVGGKKGYFIVPKGTGPVEVEFKEGSIKSVTEGEGKNGGKKPGGDGKKKGGGNGGGGPSGGDNSGGDGKASQDEYWEDDFDFDFDYADDDYDGRFDFDKEEYEYIRDEL